MSSNVIDMWQWLAARNGEDDSPDPDPVAVALAA